MNLLEQLITGCNKKTTDQIDFSNSWSDDDLSGSIDTEILFSIESDTSYVVATINATQKWANYNQMNSQDPTERGDPTIEINIEIERAEWGMIELNLNESQEKELISHIEGLLGFE